MNERTHALLSTGTGQLTATLGQLRYKDIGNSMNTSFRVLASSAPRFKDNSNSMDTSLSVRQQQREHRFQDIMHTSLSGQGHLSLKITANS